MNDFFFLIAPSTSGKHNATKNQANHGKKRSLFGANKTLFLVFLVGVCSNLASASMDVNSLQTAAAEITIEIPVDGIIDVHVFLNTLHNNPVFIDVDQRDFNLNIFGKLFSFHFYLFFILDDRLNNVK